MGNCPIDMWSLRPVALQRIEFDQVSVGQPLEFTLDVHDDHDIALNTHIIS